MNIFPASISEFLDNICIGAYRILKEIMDWKSGLASKGVWVSILNENLKKAAAMGHGLRTYILVDMSPVD